MMLKYELQLIIVLANCLSVVRDFHSFSVADPARFHLLSPTAPTSIFFPHISVCPSVCFRHTYTIFSLRTQTFTQIPAAFSAHITAPSTIKFIILSSSQFNSSCHCLIPP